MYLNYVFEGLKLVVKDNIDLNFINNWNKMI